MTARPIDLSAVRAAFDRLEAVLLIHPEAAGRAADYFAGSLLPGVQSEVVVMTKDVPVKIPGVLIDQADALIPRMEASPLLGYSRVNRSALIRVALARGLEALAAELPAAPPAPKAKRTPRVKG